MGENIIADRFGRRFPYLRLSLTDVCNFKCHYCLPDGYQKTGCTQFLNRDEILRLVRVMCDLGVWKIRLTGGEPTLRKDFLDIAQSLSEVEGLKTLALTTNGYKLPQRARSFYDAGLRTINISLDSLQAKQFKAITGHDRLTEVLRGVDAALEAGFEKIKLNTVLLKGINDADLECFIKFISDKPISLRFIELMQTRDNLAYFQKYHVSGAVITEKLLNQGWFLKKRSEGGGPALEYLHRDHQGSIGLISPYSKDFCKSCNRLRISSKGALHLCLFGEGGYDLRDYLQDDDQKEALTEKILSLLSYKKSSHFLHQGNPGAIPHLASIGG